MDAATSTTRTNTYAPPQITIPGGMASRIPASLQAIFMASNQGAEVNDAPLNGIANMEFVRGKTTVVLEKNCQPLLIPSSPGSSNSSNNISGMNKNSTFTVTKRRMPTKLALLKPTDRNKAMVRN
jgi:hypothetical protein